MSKKLDLENVTVYTKDNITDAIRLIGQDVYMSDDEKFKNYYKFRLIGVKVIEDDFHPFLGYDEDHGRQFYKYFILCKDAKFKEEENTYKVHRPYKSISEFCNETGCEQVGVDLITIRNKRRKQECVLLYTGYSEDAVHLGGYVLTFECLLKHYEFYNNCGEDGEWKPFGIEE